MIKEALQYVVGLRKPEVLNIDGTSYSDKELVEIEPFIHHADPLSMHTLTSLVEYIREKVDTMGEHMLIHVESPTEVALSGALDAKRMRERLCYVQASVPEFCFGHYYDSEEFIIALQSMFIPSADRDLLLRFAGTSEAGTIAAYGDDGVTQKATIKQGIVNKEEAIIPNPVCLQPYRTFVEVDQPASQFIFRMKQEQGMGIRCALFEADGGAWKNQACQNIEQYLKKELSDVTEPRITVIS